MVWLWFICAVLSVIIIVLAVKIVLMKRDIDVVIKDFSEKLNGDTNTLLTVSGSDKTVRRLAAEINEQLKVLRKLRLRYEQGDCELKSAVADISHDLRTPLTAIDGYLDLLEKEQKSADAERYTAVIKNRTQVLKQLSEELFRYSVITSPEYESPAERVCVNAVLEECLVSSYAALNEAQITPEIDLPENYIYCNANRMALLRIFSNLIGNAVKYSGGDLCIVLSENGEIVFSNAAPNLSATLVKKLFDRFYTVDSARKSTGLGLSISKILAERAGGSIAAEYRDGRLIITINLPVCN